jgi:surface antigen
MSALLVPAITLAGRVAGNPPVLLAFGADSHTLAQRGFFIKPAENIVPQKREVEVYTVQDGDTLSRIAEQFAVSVDTLRWANNLSDADTLSIDQQLLIPPVDGVLVTVRSGDTVQSLAQQYQVQPSAIVDFNLLRDADRLLLGTRLMIPDGVAAPLPESAPPQAPAGDSSAIAAPSVSHLAPRYIGGGDHFPWGWCTWYAASRRYVPWSGNANTWYGSAQAYGFPVGHYPRAGAIMVTWEGWWGHVAYVEAVNGACWTVSEMNYRGFGIVDYRRICQGHVPLIGFIY